MASRGIRDRVAIVGMGCTNFGEHWDKSVDDLLIESTAGRHGVGRRDRATTSTPTGWAPWDRARPASPCPGRCASRTSRSPGSRTCAPPARKPCATPATRWRPGRSTWPWPSGSRSSRTPASPAWSRAPLPCDGTVPETTAPARFSLLAPAYAKKYGVDDAEMKDVLTRIAWKNHYNGARNPRAQFRKEVSKETIAAAAPIAGMLGVFDCSGVSDGSAAAIVVRAEDAYRYTDKPLFVKGLSFVAGPARGNIDPDYDFTTFPEVVAVRGGRLRAGRGGRSPGPAGHGRGARLLHADGAGADGGSGLRRPRLWRGRRSWPGPSTSTASCRSTPTGASRPSAIRSGHRGCG